MGGSRRPGPRRRGLIESLLAWARDNEVTAFRLQVIEGNEPAVALYRRRGFRATGDVVLDGDRRELVMDRSLAGPS